MRLTEILSSPIQFEWTKQSPIESKASFSVNGHQYVVWIDAGENVPNSWELIFFLQQENGESRTDSTGTGGQFQVYSTVMAAIKQHMEKYGIRSIVMSAEDRSRQSLYPKLIRKYLPGWKVEAYDEDIVAIPPQIVQSAA